MQGFEYGWGVEGKGTGDFWVRFPACEREPKEWRQELRTAARSIADSTKKPIWLCFSGGADSEIMCEVFHEEKIPFSVLTIEHEAKTNARDIEFARIWCEEHGVHQKMITIDMYKFLKTGIDRYMKEGYVNGNVFQYFKIYLLETIEEMGGYGVVGSGEHKYIVSKEIVRPTFDDVYMEFGVGYALGYEWCRRNKVDHEPFFLHRTPEIGLSWMRLPLVDHMLHKSPEVFRSDANGYTYKRLVYQTLWPTMAVRRKANGFENLLIARRESEEKIRAYFGPKVVSYRLPLPRFVDQLTGKST